MSTFLLVYLLGAYLTAVLYCLLMENNMFREAMFYAVTMNPEIPPLTLLLVSAVFFTVLSWVGVCIMIYFIYDIVSTTIKSNSINQ